MRRYLVVANQTLGGEQLLAEVRKRMEGGPCSFHVVVPATPADQLDPAFLKGQVEHAHAVEAGGEPAAGDEERHLARLLLEDEIDVAHGHTPPGEDLGRALARERLRQSLAHLRQLGAEVAGEVGVADPVEAVQVALHRHEFDEVILSTLPAPRSRWLAQDLPSKIRRTTKLPVTAVTGDVGGGADRA